MKRQASKSRTVEQIIRILWQADGSQAILGELTPKVIQFLGSSHVTHFSRDGD